jgi:hypothetical protein
MNPLQISQFERFLDANDEAGALRWLETNVPDYRSEVSDEFDFIFGRLRAAVAAQKEAVDQKSKTEKPTR